MLEFAAVLFATLILPILAYIPATPTNSTGNTNSGGLNIPDASTILLQWYSNGCADKSIKTYLKGWSNQSSSSYAENISYQIAGKGSTGISKVAFFFPLRMFIHLIIISGCSRPFLRGRCKELNFTELVSSRHISASSSTLNSFNPMDCSHLLR